MEKLYMIRTGNRFNQLLIFTSKEAATQWAHSATMWNDEQIERNIEKVPIDSRGFYSIFPND